MLTRTTLFSRYFRTAFSLLCLVCVFFLSLSTSYMLFHTLVELFSIVVAFAVFIVTWNSRDMQDNKYLHLVGLSYLFIGALDLLHTLTFKGINMIPVEGFLANQFWIATRGMEATVFLIGFAMLNRKKRINSDLVFLVYFLISTLITLSILVWKIFPVCFIDGYGQTDFKVYAEYGIMLVLLLSLILLYRYRKSFNHKTAVLLGASIIFAILSECCFANYTTNIGPLNAIGHYFKLATFFLVYKASVEMAFVKPLNHIFRELKSSEQEYRILAENLPGIILRFDKNLRLIYSNQQSNISLSRPGLVADIVGRLKSTLRIAAIENLTQSGELMFEVGADQSDTLTYAYQIIPEVFADTMQSSLLLICRDITASKKEKQYLSSILDTIPHQVWTATPAGELEYVNGIVCRDFNDSSEHLRKQGWLQFIHPEDAPKSEKMWHESLLSGSPFLMPLRLKMFDGNYLWHISHALPVYEQNQITLWVGTNTNIDIQKKAQDQRDEFISVASHELKTPLTSIKAFNQMLSRTRDLDKIHSYLQKVDLSTGKLERLINDMLDVSRITAGKLQFSKNRINLTELLRECIETMQLSTDTHRLEYEGSDTISIEADQFRIEQVINNLLSNAIKYSPDADRVLIKCSVDQGGVVVSVKDFGIGIEAGELEKLFDRYYRSDNSAQRFGGLGLGLFISSEIIKGHGGTFWMESDLGKGSCVYFRLPLEVPGAKLHGKQQHLEYEDEHLRISCNYNKGWMEVNWKGYQTVQSVQTGGLQMVEILQKSELSKVLNDNREVLGNWSEASDWAGRVWFPMMIRAGLKDFAWVFSPSIFAKLAAQKSFDESDGAANVKFFYHMDEAVEWLDKQLPG